MNLSEIKPGEGSKKTRIRKGRGHGSGKGKTAGKGHKGQRARSGRPRVGFEGGQTPLFVRIPKIQGISWSAQVFTKQPVMNEKRKKH